MPQAARPRSRASLVFLLLTLLALPAFAGEQGVHAPKEQGLLASFWQALASLVPGMAQLGPGLDPLGGADQESNGAETDLGPELDPLG